MKAKNFDIKSSVLFNAVGYLKELGEYAGFYQDEAYEILGIDDELENDEWCDIMVSRKGEIYAVYGDTPADFSGNFALKMISDGFRMSDVDMAEKLGASIAKFNVYYSSSESVDYSIEWYKLKNGDIYMVNRHENECWVSSEEEIDEAKKTYESEYKGYWS